MTRLGLIVNPVAGLGGAMARKGSDEPDMVQRAALAGRDLVSPVRAARALRAFQALSDAPVLCGVVRPDGSPDMPLLSGAYGTAQDTRDVVRDMQGQVDLILFAGGDGTARDICAANAGGIPVLGIPSGVKMHSGVFARSPERAGQMAARFLSDTAQRTEAVEILDIDEEARRAGRLSARLYTVARTPLDSSGARQNPKAGGTDPVGEMDATLASYARRMRDDTLYILGPGMTMAALKQRLGGGTLLGVDLAQCGQIIARDVDEDALLSAIAGRNVRIGLTVVGGQGFVLGRGNQQISARVLRNAGLPPIDVICGADKLAALHPQELTIDTGDPALDAEMAGYWPVMTGPARHQVMKVVP
ncbi:Predicted polyphosphate- or ATP-dependent NAD kinase [Monaibacterium marinum]|uniref:Predicted polyphosphate- or ATP-dependent NAD kinase n=1 Tax=Pontivivens marinum TaxID=1690039 RepID=A0A2C9CTN4_9RHOB|nr:NAD(+)/NADH kinase [Monaibacterium marinum]SOH94871.1 Predicted polyphosphate- or ATP-dependent NAD kinase [Monaibacterium marinum]